MNNFKLSERSIKNLKGVHPDLVKVIKLALQKSEYDFTVIEGVRSKERQAELFKKGATKTMHSRHLTGHAVDIINSKFDWNNKKAFQSIAKAMFQAAKELNVTIRWGGDWNMNGKTNDERFYDGPHFELHRSVYP